HGAGLHGAAHQPPARRCRPFLAKKKGIRPEFFHQSRECDEPATVVAVDQLIPAPSWSPNQGADPFCLIFSRISALRAGAQEDPASMAPRDWRDLADPRLWP